MEEIVVNYDFVQYVETLEMSNNNEGDPVTVFLRGKTVSLERCIDYVSNLITGGGDDLILPKNCRYVVKDSEFNTILIIEDEPQVRTVLFDIDISTMISTLKHTGKLKEYEFEYLTGEDAPKSPFYFSLAFPYIVYVCKFDSTNRLSDMKLFYRRSPITSLSDSLYTPNLTNISQDFNVCLGKPTVDPTKVKMSLLEWYNEAMDRFWRNAFNKDFIVNYQKYCNHQYVSDLLTWCYFSAKDPMFVFDVDWIPSGLILQTVVNSLKTIGDISFHDLKQKIFSTLTIEEDHKKGDLVHSYCESTILKHSIDNEQYYELFIGDELQIYETTYYVLSFICKNGEKPHIALLEDKDGNQKSIELGRTGVIDSLIWDLKTNKESLSSVMINGVELQVGNFIRVNLEDKNEFELSGYNAITDFRKGRDGKIETKLGRDYYLLENVDFEVITGDKIKIKGVELIADKVYFLLRSDGNTRPGAIYSKKIFKGITTKKGIAGLFLRFDSIVNEIETLSPDDFSQVIDVDDIPPDVIQTNVTRIGFSIFTAKGDPILIRKGDGCYNCDSTNIKRLYNGIAAKKRILFGEGLTTEDVKDDEDVIIDVKVIGEITSINIPGFDIDIKFSIGDTIIVADWTDVNTMLRIWKITKFEIESDNILYITAINDLSNIIKIPYILFKTGRINVGYIRHVSREYCGLKEGTLLKANTSQIPNFPKKDYVKIIGFITDTADKKPLIYCSNLTTLRIDRSLSNFDAIKITEPAWFKNVNKVLPPNADKLQKQIQPGDIMIFTSDGYNSLKSSGTDRSQYPGVVARHAGYMRKYTVYEMKYGFEFTNTPGLAHVGFLRDSLRYGILSPRVSDWDDEEAISGWPDFHNGLTLSNRSNVSL